MNGNPLPFYVLLILHYIKVYYLGVIMNDIKRISEILGRELHIVKQEQLDDFCKEIANPSNGTPIVDSVREHGYDIFDYPSQSKWAEALIKVNDELMFDKNGLPAGFASAPHKFVPNGIGTFDKAMSHIDTVEFIASEAGLNPIDTDNVRFNYTMHSLRMFEEAGIKNDSADINHRLMQELFNTKDKFLTLGMNDDMKQCLLFDSDLRDKLVDGIKETLDESISYCRDNLAISDMDLSVIESIEEEPSFDFNIGPER